MTTRTIECPVCTYLNTDSFRRCAMCGHAFQQDELPPTRTESVGGGGSSSSGSSSDGYLKPPQRRKRRTMSLDAEAVAAPTASLRSTVTTTTPITSAPRTSQAVLKDAPTRPSLSSSSSSSFPKTTALFQSSTDANTGLVRDGTYTQQTTDTTITTAPTATSQLPPPTTITTTTTTGTSATTSTTPTAATPIHTLPSTQAAAAQPSQPPPPPIRPHFNTLSNDELLAKSLQTEEDAKGLYRRRLAKLFRQQQQQPSLSSSGRGDPEPDRDNTSSSDDDDDDNNNDQDGNDGDHDSDSDNDHHDQDASTAAVSTPPRRRKRSKEKRKRLSPDHPPPAGPVSYPGVPSHETPIGEGDRGLVPSTTDNYAQHSYNNPLPPGTTNSSSVVGGTTYGTASTPKRSHHLAMQFHKDEELMVSMMATTRGRSWKFVQEVLKLYSDLLRSHIDMQDIVLLDVDDIIYLAEQFHMCQAYLRKAKRPSQVTSGYVYTHAYCVDSLRSDGLLVRHSPELFRACGNGIYVGKNALTLRYMGDTGLLAAVLLGRDQVMDARPVPPPPPHPKHVDTYVTRHEGKRTDQSVLKRSSQCLPLFSYKADSTDIEAIAEVEVELTSLLIRWFNIDDLDDDDYYYPASPKMVPRGGGGGGGYGGGGNGPPTTTHM